jgi:hypothetical protein
VQILRQCLFGLRTAVRARRGTPPWLPWLTHARHTVAFDGTGRHRGPPLRGFGRHLHARISSRTLKGSLCPIMGIVWRTRFHHLLEEKQQEHSAVYEERLGFGTGFFPLWTPAEMAWLRNEARVECPGKRPAWNHGASYLHPLPCHVQTRIGPRPAGGGRPALQSAASGHRMTAYKTARARGGPP